MWSCILKYIDLFFAKRKRKSPHNASCCCEHWFRCCRQAQTLKTETYCLYLKLTGKIRTNENVKVSASLTWKSLSFRFELMRTKQNFLSVRLNSSAKDYVIGTRFYSLSTTGGFLVAVPLGTDSFEVTTSASPKSNIVLIVTQRCWHFCKRDAEGKKSESFQCS